jgi:hypothetical protein
LCRNRDGVSTQDRQVSALSEDLEIDFREASGENKTVLPRIAFRAEPSMT